MVERLITIGSSHGLHARPAKLFTQAAAASGASVTVTKGDTSVNAASILGVISLGVDHGDQITLTVEGADEERILGELEELLVTDQDEA